MSLSAQFGLAGGLIMLLAMLTVGSWVTHKIADQTVAHWASATAMFMDSFVAPLAQELEKTDTLSIGPIRALDEVMTGTALGERVVRMKIWKAGGLVAYADDLRLIGRRIGPTGRFSRAFAGEVVAELDAPDPAEDNESDEQGRPLLEIYSPIRQPWSGKVIAVAEFYEDATDLERKLGDTRRESWFIVAAASGMVFLSLFGIVHRGSRIIDRQRDDLQTRIRESERISEQNRALRIRTQLASSRFSELNETHLRRIGADLHDGAAQLIGLAALKVGHARAATSPEERDLELGRIQNALTDAMREIRGISRGLILPEIEELPLGGVIAKAAMLHEERTGTTVRLDCAPLPAVVSPAVKICVYRFVQEGLQNAFRHGQGQGQAVECASEDGVFRLRVLNSRANGPAAMGRPGLGLAGLRERVESLGGSFVFELDTPAGTVLSMTIDLKGAAPLA